MDISGNWTAYIVKIRHAFAIYAVQLPDKALHCLVLIYHTFSLDPAPLCCVAVLLEPDPHPSRGVYFPKYDIFALPSSFKNDIFSPS